jgi:putative membrane protein
MIPSYGDHAANERTFLAWVRTALAIMSFGIVIEKFNLFIRTLAMANESEAVARAPLERLANLAGRHDGLVLVSGGLALVAIQTVRFIRNGRLLDHGEPQPSAAIRTESIVAAALLLIVAATSILFAF